MGIPSTQWASLCWSECRARLGNSLVAIDGSAVMGQGSHCCCQDKCDTCQEDGADLAIRAGYGKLPGSCGAGIIAGIVLSCAEQLCNGVSFDPEMNACFPGTAGGQPALQDPAEEVCRGEAGA